MLKIHSKLVELLLDKDNVAYVIWPKVLNGDTSVDLWCAAYSTDNFEASVEGRVILDKAKRCGV